MKLYIAGPMSGRPDNNVELFNRAAALLTSAGYGVINPADLDQALPYEKLIRFGLVELLTFADGVALLPGWEFSEGAALEHAVAKKIGLPIKDLVRWYLEADTSDTFKSEGELRRPRYAQGGVVSPGVTWSPEGGTRVNGEHRPPTPAERVTPLTVRPKA